VVGRDYGRAACWNVLPIAVIDLELDVQDFQQTLSKSSSGPGPARDVETVHHLVRNQ
jgi:hypothetical protein